MTTEYRASCHCGAFVYTVALPAPLTQVYACNCSICVKKAYLFVFEPPSRIQVVKGAEDALASYKFGATYDHRFCRTCGVAVYVDSAERKGLNARCFQGVDLWALETLPFDGAALPTPPSYTRPVLDADTADDAIDPSEGPSVYRGSCHCGAVTLTMRSRALDALSPATDRADRVIECNCSICRRLGCTWFYPRASQVQVSVSGSVSGSVTASDTAKPGATLQAYAFGPRTASKTFCGTCGVPMTQGLVELAADELAQLPAACRSATAVAGRESLRTMRPVNLRVMDGIDLAALPVEHFDGTGLEPPYVEA